MSTYSSVFTLTAGPYVVPAGVTELEVWSIGPGASAHAGAAASNGGGGGGPGAAGHSVLAVTPGETLDIAIGSPGAETAHTSNAAGQNGGDITISRGATVIFKVVGGKTPATTAGAGVAGQASDCIADDAYTGTNGGAGNRGGTTGLGGNGGNAPSVGPLTGGTGGLGAGSPGPSGNGLPGNNYGGGGGGGRNLANYWGGAGAPGILQGQYPLPEVWS